MVYLLLSPTFPFFFIGHFLDYQKVGKKSRNFFTTTPIPKWRKLRKDHFLSVLAKYSVKISSSFAQSICNYED